MSSNEKPLSKDPAGQTSQSINDIKQSKQSGNNQGTDDIVVMDTIDQKNNTMRTVSRRNDKKDMMTALWKGQSTMATLASNPLKSSMFRASTVQHGAGQKNALNNTQSHSQSREASPGLIAAIPPDRSDHFKYQLN